MTVTIGVLALQGDVREHLAALSSVGARGRPVRRPEELSGLDGLILPGGESTTMDKLLRAFELDDPLRAAIAGGLAVYGSCAGMILLADRVLDAVAGQRTIGGLDIAVRRNAFGRQVDSFEADLALDRPAGGEPIDLRAVFIRAPWVEDVGPGVRVLARVPGAIPTGEFVPAPGPDTAPAAPAIGIPAPAAGKIVAVQQGRLLATSFHPEISGDARVHELFIEIVKG